MIMARFILPLLWTITLLTIFFASRPVFAVVLFAALLVNWRLFVPMKLGRGLSRALSLLVIAYACSFIAYQSCRSVEWLWVYPLPQIAPSVIGFLSFAILLALLKDLILCVLRKGKSRVAQRVAGVLVLLLSLAAGLYSIEVTKHPRVDELVLTLPEEARGLDGLRIVQISDLHITQDSSQEWLARVIELTQAQNPDLIVVTGDIVELDLPDHGGVLNPLKQLRARYGVYSILGNHDYFRDESPRLVELLRELGMPALMNENVVIKQGGSALLLAGVTDPASTNFPPALQPSPERAMVQAEATQYKILLSHQPKLAEQAAAVGYDLQLSGHTHGGQFYPWCFVTETLLTYNKGLYRVGDMQLYVNQGTGAWIPLRWGTHPEITLITLRAPQKSI